MIRIERGDIRKAYIRVWPWPHIAVRGKSLGFSFDNLRIERVAPGRERLVEYERFFWVGGRRLSIGIKRLSQ